VKKPPMSFEKALDRLEAIVEKLEGEELGLDASLALFEEGIGLSRVCQEKLSEVERRVEIVLKDAGGKYSTAPFADEEEVPEGAAGAETESEADGGE